MSNEMLMRVARAIRASDLIDLPDDYCGEPGGDVRFGRALFQARAAIEAMRECTDEMNDAGSDQCDGGAAAKSCQCGFMGKIWTAMIDEALKP